MAVYDDVRGWNTEQYMGHGEFYLEYGDIDFAITAADMGASRPRRLLGGPACTESLRFSSG